MNYEVSKEYTERAYRLIRERDELKHLLDYDFEFVVLVSDKEKKSKKKVVFGECEKVKDQYKEFIPYDFLIYVYEKNCAEMSEDQIDNLLVHEMLHMDIDDSNGDPVYSINPHDVEDFRIMIDKYGIDWAKAGE